MEDITKSIQYLDIEGLSFYDSLIKAKIATDIVENHYDDTELKAKVTNNENAIIILNGEGEGSVKKQVDDAVARIISEAPETYDTLKEISDWISSHADDASTMNSQINTNKADILTLKALIGTLPDGAASTTIVAYITEAIGASEIDLTSAIATAKSEAVSEATTIANKALVDAKTYADKATKELSDGQVATNKANIEDLQTRLDGFDFNTYTPITKEEIRRLFSSDSE